MSDLNLSLYKIESDLAALVSMRDDAREELSRHGATADEVSAELQSIDNAIRAYIAAEIRKADSIADLLLMLDRVAGPPKERKDGKAICELDQEIERLRQRRDNLRERAEHLKGIVSAVMQEMEWKPGKPRKIEGVRHTLSLVGNGGKQPVIVSDEALVPDEFCTVTVTMTADLWRELVEHVAECPHTGELDGRFYKIMPARAPFLSLIAAELVKPCENPRCNKGVVVEDGEELVCGSCGGSGKRGVPGASLAPRGEHVRVS